MRLSSSFSVVKSDFLHAVQFMTRLPVERWVVYDPSAMPRCALYFPVVGALIGLASGLAYSLAASGFPLLVTVGFAMLVPVLLTGAMHEDGLADAADGLCGHASRERALEIMRDSRIGSYGAIVLAFLLAFRFSALASLGSAEAVLRAMIAAAAVGRAGAVFLLSTCINVRTDSPTSRPFGAGLSQRSLVWCLGGTFAGAAVLLGFHVQALIAAALVIFALRQFFVRRLGGITGDCLGAVIALSEVTVLVVYSGR